MPATAAPGFADQVKGAVIWRSGSQIAGQLIAWAATFLVIRMLEPERLRPGRDDRRRAHLPRPVQRLGIRQRAGPRRADRPAPDRPGVRHAAADQRRRSRAVQFAAAPLAADYFHQPMVADLLRVQALFYPRQPVHRARPRAADPADGLQAPGAGQPDRRGAQRADRARLRAAPGSASGPWSPRRSCSGTRGRSAMSIAARLWIRPSLPLRRRRRDGSATAAR